MNLSALMIDKKNSKKKKTRIMSTLIKLVNAAALFMVVSPVFAQHSKTEAITYHDNDTLWVMGQTAKVTCVAPAECTPAYAPTGVVMSETTYNSLAQPVTVTSFGALQQTLTYQADGNLATVKDGNNNTTSFGNWKRGIPQSITFADNTGISAVVNDHGWLDSVTNEVAARTCYAYDAMGRLIRTTYPSETVDNTCSADHWNERTSEFRAMTAADWKPPGYSEGQWRHYETQGNYAKVTYYDALWRPLLSNEYDASNTAATLRSVSTQYDSDGRVVFQSYAGSTVVPAATGTWTEYDALGRVTSVSQDTELAAPATTVTEYLTGFKTRVTNPRGAQTVTEYQTFETPDLQAPTLVRALGSVGLSDVAATEIERDVFGKPRRISRRDGDNTLRVDRRYVYQSDQKLCKVIEPETGATVYGYDWAGNLTKSAAGLLGYGDTSACHHAQAFASGRVVDRTYDARNRLKTLRFPDTQGDQDWTYTAAGQPATITTHNGPTGGSAVVNVYTYNKRGLLSAESLTQPNWYSWYLGYGYDRNGALSANTYPTGLAISYYTNALGQPTQVQDQNGQVYASGVQYFPNGGMKQFTYGNGVVHTMAQNARQLPARVTDSGGVLDNEYVYDANANVQYIYDWVNPNLHRYLYYDSLDRLTSAGSQMFGGDHWHRFTYDALDNLTSWKLAGVKDYAHYVYDANNRLTNIQNTAGATAVGLLYDEQGNLRNKNGQAYDFDFGNRLRGSAGETYRYDGQGRRITMWDATGYTLPIYGQSGQLPYVADFRRGMGEENVYLGGSLLAIRETTIATGAVRVLYQHTDALGSPVAVTDASGAVATRNYYEPYGAVIGKPTYQGIGFTGHVQDGATGLTYMQQRYYDAQCGCFLSVDPVTAYTSGDMRFFNRYTYVANNPYKFTDPDGRILDTIADVGFIAYSGYKLITEPSWTNAAALGADVVGAVVPFATGLGAGVRAASHGADVVKGVDAAVDTGKAADFIVSSNGTVVHNSPDAVRASLEGAGFKGENIANKAGTETGTLHNVPDMKMDIRVMDGGPNHPPRVVTNQQGTSSMVDSATGKPFRNEVPKPVRAERSHIKFSGGQ